MKKEDKISKFSLPIEFKTHRKFLGGITMQAVKQKIYSMVETLPDSQLMEIANFILFIKLQHENESFNDLEKLSVSSIGFWNNEIDDEVWNNV